MTLLSLLCAVLCACVSAQPPLRFRADGSFKIVQARRLPPKAASTSRELR